MIIGDNGLEGKFKKESLDKKADDAGSPGNGPGGCPGGGLGGGSFNN